MFLLDCGQADDNACGFNDFAADSIFRGNKVFYCHLLDLGIW